MTRAVGNKITFILFCNIVKIPELYRSGLWSPYSKKSPITHIQGWIFLS